MSKDYYKILELPKTAGSTEIRNAYLRLARTWHPDLKKDPVEKDKNAAVFQDIAEAYEVLSHPARKSVYDKGGINALTAGGKRTTTGRIGQNAGIPPNSAERLVGQFCGIGIPGLDPTTGSPLGGNTIPGFNLNAYANGKTTTTANGMRTTTFTHQSRKGSDPSKAAEKRKVLLPLECSYEELFSGCEKDVEWDAYENGKQITKVYTVDVKAGWMVGQKIEVKDDYDEVTIIVTEKPHDLFTRKKNDLYYNCNITLRQAICGGEIVIPTIVDGKNLKLCFNKIDNGFVHEISGHGMPIVDNDERGKLIVTFIVKLPKLSENQVENICAILDEE